MVKDEEITDYIEKFAKEAKELSERGLNINQLERLSVLHLQIIDAIADHPLLNCSCNKPHFYMCSTHLKTYSLFFKEAIEERRICAAKPPVVIDDEVKEFTEEQFSFLLKDKKVH